MFDAPIGYGSYGLVIKAKKHNRSYAIKTYIRDEHGPQADIQQQLFHYEAEILRQVNHARIPKYLERFTFEQNEYLVQEYVDGEPLSSMLLKGHLFSEREIIGLIGQLLEILGYLHQKNIVHRDLRLGNLLVSHGRLYVVDFGLARKFSGGCNADVLPEPVPRNCSPAYLALRREISPRSDLYGTAMVALDLMGNWFAQEPDTLCAYPTSESFRFFLKKLLKACGGFVTAFDALAELKNI